MNTELNNCDYVIERYLKHLVLLIKLGIVPIWVAFDEFGLDYHRVYNEAYSRGWDEVDSYPWIGKVSIEERDRYATKAARAEMISIIKDRCEKKLDFRTLELGRAFDTPDSEVVFVSYEELRDRLAEGAKAFELMRLDHPEWLLDNPTY